MIRLGAYRRGADAAVDAAIAVNPALEEFLSQTPAERQGLDESYAGLAAAMGIEIVADDPAEAQAESDAAPEAQAE